MTTEIDIETFKSMAATSDSRGARLTIHGDIHRVEKVNVRARTLTTVRGEVVSFDDVYKKGRGFFADPDQKGKKKSRVKDEEPAPKSSRGSRSSKTEQAPKSSRGSRTSKDDDDEDAKPTGRARNRRNGTKAEEKAPKSSRTRKVPREDVEETKPKTRRKRMVEVTEFNQEIAEKLNDYLFQAIREQITLPFSVVPVASGATYGEQNMKFQIVFMPSGTKEKEIKKFLNEHRASTDIMPEDEQDDPLDELDDDDEDDTPEEEEDGDDDPDDLEDDEEDEDGDDDADDELEDDEDDSEEEEDDEEEDDESNEEDEADAAIEQIVDSIIEAAPNLKRDKVEEYVNSYLTNDEIEEKVGDDLTPGSSLLTDKGKDLQFLLVGFDEENQVVKLLNTETQKYRNRSIDELVHMDEV